VKHLKTLATAFWLTAGLSGFSNISASEYTEQRVDVRGSVAASYASKLKHLHPDQADYFLSIYTLGTEDQARYGYVGIRTGLILAKAYSDVGLQPPSQSESVLALLEDLATVLNSHLHVYRDVWDHAIRQRIEHQRSPIVREPALTIIEFEHLRLGAFQALEQARMAARTEVSRLRQWQYPETVKLYITLLRMGSLALDPQRNNRGYQTFTTAVDQLVEGFERAMTLAKLELTMANNRRI
jgi:hypothetical protein